jgi:hypothetical protein
MPIARRKTGNKKNAYANFRRMAANLRRKMPIARRMAGSKKKAYPIPAG